MVSAPTSHRRSEPVGADRPTPLQTWWRGRYGRALVVEVALILCLLTLYRLGRLLGRDQVGAAFDNAREVVDLENRLGFGNERGLQELVLENLTAIRFFNRYYATAHFPLTAAFLVVTYIRAPAVYRHIRVILLAVTAVGLVIHIAYPLAPPRMLRGFVDTVAAYGPSIYDRPGVASVANQYAAMPSLHVGWAAIVSYGVYQMWTGPVRWVGVAHALLTTVAVVVTANHYWLDILVALAMVAAAIAVVRWRANRDWEAVVGPATVATD